MQPTTTPFTRFAGKVLATLLAALLLPGAAAATTVLRYSDHEPLGGMRTRFIKDVFLPPLKRSRTAA